MGKVLREAKVWSEGRSIKRHTQPSEGRAGTVTVETTVRVTRDTQKDLITVAICNKESIIG